MEKTRITDELLDQYMRDEGINTLAVLEHSFNLTKSRVVAVSRANLGPEKEDSIK